MINNYNNTDNCAQDASFFIRKYIYTLDYDIKNRDRNFNPTHYNIPPLLSEMFSVACFTQKLVNFTHTHTCGCVESVYTLFDDHKMWVCGRKLKL